MKTFAYMGAAAVTGWMLLAAPAPEGAMRAVPLVTSATAATCATDCESRSSTVSLVEEMGGLLAKALSPARVQPAYADLWISKEELHRLARHHGTHALKITETKVFIRRDGNWIPVLAL